METIGARLKQAREQRHLTLQQASDITKVRIHYLQALETDDLSAMPSAAQARGFLRLYTDFLGVNLADLSASLSSQEVGAPTVPEPIAPAPVVPPTVANIDVPASSSPSEETSAKNLGLRLFTALRKRLRRKASKEPDTSQTAEAETELSGREIEAIPTPDHKSEGENKSGTNPVSGDFSTDDSGIVKKN